MTVGRVFYGGANGAISEEAFVAANQWLVDQADERRAVDPGGERVRIAAALAPDFRSRERPAVHATARLVVEHGQSCHILVDRVIVGRLDGQAGLALRPSLERLWAAGLLIECRAVVGHDHVALFIPDHERLRDFACQMAPLRPHHDEAEPCSEPSGHEHEADQTSTTELRGDTSAPDPHETTPRSKWFWQTSPLLVSIEAASRRPIVWTDRTVAVVAPLVHQYRQAPGSTVKRTTANLAVDGNGRWWFVVYSARMAPALSVPSAWQPAAQKLWDAGFVISCAALVRPSDIVVEVPHADDLAKCASARLASAARSKARHESFATPNSEPARPPDEPPPTTPEVLLEQLQTVPPAVFEELTAELLRRLGFTESIRTPGSGDGGVDVRASLVIGKVLTIRMAVQAKRWANAVGTPVVRELRGSLGAHEHGLIITTGVATAKARTEARRSDAAPVALLEGLELAQLLLDHGLAEFVASAGPSPAGESRSRG